MGIVFGRFQEELLAIGMMMFGGRGGGGKRRLDTFGRCQFKSPINFIGGYMVESFTFIFFRQ